MGTWKLQIGGGDGLKKSKIMTRTPGAGKIVRRRWKKKPAVERA